MLDGITPTYMGNTFFQLQSHKHYEDHPHIHGEHLVEPVDENGIGGSPPHTWGTQMNKREMLNRFRITPTYMGNTVCLQMEDQQ